MKFWPHGGTRGEVRGSPKSLLFILWGPKVSVQHFMPIRPVGDEVFQSGSKWWTWTHAARSHQWATPMHQLTHFTCTILLPYTVYSLELQILYVFIQSRKWALKMLYLLQFKERPSGIPGQIPVSHSIDGLMDHQKIKFLPGESFYQATSHVWLAVCLSFGVHMMARYGTRPVTNQARKGDWSYCWFNHIRKMELVMCWK